MKALIRKYREAEEAVDKAQKVLNAAKKKRDTIEERLKKQMDAKGLTIVGDNTTGRVRIDEVTHYSIANHTQFVRYVARNRAYELFQNRISKRALEERLDAGKKVPGVRKYDEKKVRLVKARGG